jgi:hypothetical protein
MYYRYYFRLQAYRFRRGLHAPVTAGLSIFVSDTAEYIHMEMAPCLLVVHLVMNYEIPVVNKRENL